MLLGDVMRWLSQCNQENGMAEPRTDDDHMHLFSQIASLPSFQKKGPVCKLMRWFSFNETAKWYHGNSEDGQLSGQLWATKMILEYHFKQQGANCDEQAEPTPQLPVSESDPKEELRKLRAQTGALRLTPTLITDSNVWVLDLIMAVSSASWNSYGEKAKHLRSVDHAVEEALNEQQGLWQSELVSLVARCLNGSDNRKYFNQLGLLASTGSPELTAKIDKLVDIVLLIIHNRCKSMVTVQDLPPFRLIGQPLDLQQPKP